MFHLVADAVVILRGRNGVYKQAKVYSRNGYLYAGSNGGYVMLKKTGTSHPDLLWDEITLPFDQCYDKFERMRNPAVSAPMQLRTIGR